MTTKKSLVWQNCSEAELKSKLSEWLGAADTVKNLDRTIIFLEGPLGAGKSTFVRTLLSLLAPDQKSAGSPTFPIVQEYVLPKPFPLIHIDLYRLKKENEIYEAGVDDILDTVPSLICVEWSSLFADYFQYWMDPSRVKNRRIINIKIDPASSGDLRLRNFTFS